MKQYIITIIGATLLSAMAGIISPEKWRSYVQVITGLVIISCIVAPVTSLAGGDLFGGFDNVEQNISEGEDLHRQLVEEELQKRVNGDIQERMKKEYNLDITAECKIRVNEEGAIEGVESVRVYGDKLSDRARARICEVYGLKPDEVHDE